MSIIKKFHIFELVYAQNLTSKKYFEFSTKLSQKGYFWSNAEKMNITTELCIFRLV